ncbi:MAG: TIGR02302 family protein [Pseudomonadota bacterium]
MTAFEPANAHADDAPAPAEPSPGVSIRVPRGLMARARGVLFWERIWPIALAALAAPFAFVIVSLFDVWRHTPVWAHVGALVAAAGLAVYAVRRQGAGFALPTRRDAAARIEADAGLAHAPLQALADRPSAGDASNPLWRAHQTAMAEQARAARLNRPALGAAADRVDPKGLRFAAPGLFAVALAAAGPETATRLSLAVNPGAASGASSAVVDLWIDPPAYTGTAPIYLHKAGERLGGLRDQVDAPAGSTVVAQVNGARRFRLDFQTEAETVDAEAPHEKNDAGRVELGLTESGLVRLRLAGRTTAWPIGVLKDRAPRVRFVEPPAGDDDGRVGLAVRIDDDYGAAAGRLVLTLDPDQERPLDAPPLGAAALAERRAFDLPGLTGAPGERRIAIDLQADKWAGLGVVAVVEAEDGAGQTARSEPATLVLPSRTFFRPLAKAVIEHRRDLAAAPQAWTRAGRAFDAMTFAPEFFYDRPKDYLLMRGAYWNVMRRKGEDVDETVAAFWPLALQLEDEALELARRRLEAAEDALRAALERGAGDDEVNALVEALRAAMDDYVQALADAGAQDQSDGRESNRQLDDGDLDALLDAVRDLSEAGAQGAARQALSDLAEILRNLQVSRGAGGGGGRDGEPGDAQGDGEGGEGDQAGAAGRAGDLIGRQRVLADETYAQSLDGAAGAGAGAPDAGALPGASPGSPTGPDDAPGAAGGGRSADDIASDQRALSRDLSELRADLEESDAAGAAPGAQGDPADETRALRDEAGRAFEEADRSMRDAERALQRGDFETAETAMEDAIDGLRDGAEALAEAQNRDGARQADGGEGPGGGVDPLGRPVGPIGDGRSVGVPDEAAYQRARDVLLELRRRLSEGERTEEEIEYLERLLERF